MFSREVLLIALLIAKSLYFPLNRRKSKYYWKINLDDQIPLLSWFVIPYVGFYLYIAFTIVLLWNTKYIQPMLFAYLYAYLIGCIFWYLFPNGVKRPLIYGKTKLDQLTAYLYSIDNDTNGFPSAHVFTTIICAYFLHLAFANLSPVTITSAVLIVLSTLFIKQHYILDILGGIIVSLLVLLTPVLSL